MNQQSQNNGLMSLLVGDVGSQLSSQLPSGQQLAVNYLEAVVAFWVIGGVTLYLVNRLSK